MDRGAWWTTVHGWHRVEMTEVTEQQHDKGQSRKQAANIIFPY